MGGAEPPGFQTVTDYLIYTSRLCNSYYMSMSVTSCLLCLGAYAQARYMVVCLSVCLSVSPTTFSRSTTGYTYIYTVQSCNYYQSVIIILLLTVYISGIYISRV